MGCQPNTVVGSIEEMTGFPHSCGVDHENDGRAMAAADSRCRLGIRREMDLAAGARRQSFASNRLQEPGCSSMEERQRRLTWGKSEFDRNRVPPDTCSGWVRLGHMLGRVKRDLKASLVQGQRCESASRRQLTGDDPTQAPPAA
jgi:hypothetical protein